MSEDVIDMMFSASLACADYLNFERDINCLIDGGITTLHIDIMDGHYVPNLCLNLDLINSIKQRFPSLSVEAHLMVTNPSYYIDELAQLGIDSVTIHLDSTSFAYRMLYNIKNKGMKAGIAINPAQTIMLVDPVVDIADLVLLMSVEPGYTGQKFIAVTYNKINMLMQIKRKRKLNFLTYIDGGIDLENGKKCAELGANCLVLGVFSIFNQSMGITDASRNFISRF